MQFALKPIPHTEAAALISDKPAVTREIFNRLPEEMQARAFTITGIEDFDVLQAVRDELATLPAGADWNAVKKEVMAKISPWFTPEGAARRAQLLMSHHAFAAYSATQARIMDAQIDIFPFRQYLSTKDGKVRASHAALDGIILPADHKFWEFHTPPWEWNCRCQVVELTQEDRDEAYDRDQKRAPENRSVLEGPNLAQLETGSLNRGPSVNVDVRTPKERGGTYQWSASQVTLPYEEIRQRWTTATAENFESWAGKHPITKTTSLLDYLNGTFTRPRIPLAPRPATFAAALQSAGLAGDAAWSRENLANLHGSLRVQNPAQAADLLTGIRGARSTGVLTTREITRTVQDLLDILPPQIAATLPKLEITLTQYLTDDRGNRKPGIAGDYRSLANGGPRIRLAVDALKGLTGERRRREMRKLLSHELMHWVHRDATGPAADRYRAVIQSHYLTRTAGDIALPDGHGGFFRADHFHNLYAGREYAWENGQPAGREIPSMYFELWQHPETAIREASAANPHAAAFRETFALVHSIFDSP